MARSRVISHHGEAIVLRTWPFQEADLLVSLFTREQGVVKGVARHAMRSRRRFGGALEPGTQVIAHYAERPREDLVRLDSFEILWSPLRASMDWARMAGLQLVVEALEQALPEQAPEDHVFRLALTVLQAMEPSAVISGEGDGVRAHLGDDVTVAKRGHPGEARVKLAVTYFCVWMCRLMGWWPELGHCAVCGLDLGSEDVWWSPVADGVTCRDDRRSGSERLGAGAVRDAYAMLRSSLPSLMEGDWPAARMRELKAFATGVLERHLERRLRSAAALKD